LHLLNTPAALQREVFSHDPGPSVLGGHFRHGDLSYGMLARQRFFCSKDVQGDANCHAMVYTDVQKHTLGRYIRQTSLDRIDLPELTQEVAGEWLDNISERLRGLDSLACPHRVHRRFSLSQTDAEQPTVSKGAEFTQGD